MFRVLIAYNPKEKCWELWSMFTLVNPSSTYGEHVVASEFECFYDNLSCVGKLNYETRTYAKAAYDFYIL